MMREEGRKQAQVSSTARERAVSGALLDAKWESVDARIAAEVRLRGTLPEGELTEEEIAHIAVAMTEGDVTDTRRG